MNPRTRLPCGILSLFLACPVLAEEEAHIEEIQVTATRRPAPEFEVSAALSVVDDDEIAHARLATDALTSQPGVFLQQTTPGQGAAIIRGLKGSEVLHLVDGMRLNNAIFRNAPTQYLALVAPGTIDRIEILRGAPASLYGSDALGGVVHVVSRVPAFESPGSRRTLQALYDSAELAKGIRGALEFGDSRAAALFSAEFLDTGSRRTGGGNRIPVPGYESAGGRVAVSLTPDETRSWLFDVQYARQPKTPRADELVPGFGQAEPGSAEFFFAPNSRAFAHIRHARKGPFEADWTFDLGWQRIEDDRVSRDFGSTTRRYEQNASDLFGISATASGLWRGGSWIAGAEAYRDVVSSSRVEEDTGTGGLAVVTPRFPDRSTAEQGALFAKLDWRLGDRHLLSSGVRLSAVESTLAASGPSEAATTRQEDLSADLGWITNLAERTQLTANLGFGFRAPNIFDLGTLGERPGNRFNIPNPDLGSEHVTQFDVGIRHRGERLDVSVVAFTLRYDDRIASVDTGEVTGEGRVVTQSRNVDAADIRGIEAGASWMLSDAVSIDGVLNLTRGEQTGEAGTTVPGDRIPPLNGRLSMRIEARGGVIVEPFVRFAARQVRLSPRDSGDPRIDPNGTAGWATLNVAADWQVSDGWSLSAAWENLLDKRYRVHGSGIDAPGQGIYLSVRVNW